MNEELLQEQEEQVTAAPEQTEEPGSGPQMSFRELRERAERERARAERAEREYERLLKERESITRNTQAPQEPQLSEDDLVDRRYVDRKLGEYKTQMQTYQLKSSYPDFDQVVNDATVAELRRQDPEFLDLLQNTQDVYKAGSALYKQIKRLGVYTPDHYAENRARAQENIGKPKNISAAQPASKESPLNRAHNFENGLTPELRDQLYKEMNRFRQEY